jgi:Radical SAM superfamily
MTATSPNAASLPVLPVPEVPVRPPDPSGSGPVAFTSGHHFDLAGDADPGVLAETATVPLSVIVQVTKRCDFGCVFCSETLQMADPALEQLDVIRANLAGVRRVFLSGGEPLLRRDITEIAEIYLGFIIGLPTNATRGVEVAPRLAGKVAFVNIGFDGPRATFTRVRGDYDKALRGVKALAAAGLPLSLSQARGDVFVAEVPDTILAQRPSCGMNAAKAAVIRGVKTLSAVSGFRSTGTSKCSRCSSRARAETHDSVGCPSAGSGYPRSTTWRARSLHAAAMGKVITTSTSAQNPP